MLPIKNRTVTLKRLTQSGEKRVFTTISPTFRVYINQSSEELVDGYDNEGAFFAHKMMTDGTHTAILIGDRITDDQGKTYDVRGKSVFNDMTGTHHQYLLIETYS